MKAFCRDLGQMDYKTCWDLQQTLFDALATGKTTRKATPEGGNPALSATDPGQGAGTEPGDSGSATAAPDSDKAVPGTGFEPAAGPADGKAPETKNTAQEAGTILLVEHPPVYTLGKSGHAENLLVGRETLEAMGAQFFHIDRGGDITFHGPGQLVCYPILDLERLGIGLRAYIDALEESVIRTVAEYGIRAGRIAGASGVWVGAGIAEGGEARTADDGGKCTQAGVPRKICAIGVRSSRYITMHGFALNVTTDLEWFSRINPCGFTDRGVTSIERETGGKIPMDDVKRLVVKFLSEILNVRIYK